MSTGSDIRPDCRLGAGGGRSSGVGWSSASHAPVGKRSLAVPQTPTAATNRRFWKIESSLALKSGPSLQYIDKDQHSTENVLIKILRFTQQRVPARIFFYSVDPSES